MEMALLPLSFPPQSVQVTPNERDSKRVKAYYKVSLSFFFYFFKSKV